jgi:hypothetical protein
METIDKLNKIENINEEISDITNKKTSKKKKFDIVINYF